MTDSKKWSSKDDEFHDEEDEEDLTQYQSQKDAILFAIHVSDSMLSEPDETGVSAIRTALQCAYDILQSRIIATPNDMMGILLFGTEETKFMIDSGNDAGGGFEHCYLLMDLDIPDAESIKTLKNLLEDIDSFKNIMKPSNSTLLMANLLFGVNQIFSNRAANFQSRRLFIVTDDDDPQKDNKVLKNSAITRARDLYDLGVKIEAFFIENPTRGFVTSKFYDDIIYRDPFDDEESLTIRGGDRLRAMVSNIRSKSVAKRAQFSTKLELGPGLDFGVKGYVTIKRQEKARSHYVFTGGEWSRLVTGTTTNLAERTAKVVQKTDIKKAYKFGGTKVVFNQEETKAMRDFGDTVIRVIGFKSKEFLTFDFNLKSATFLYPDEQTFVGSTRTFASLRSKLIADNKIAVVWLIARKNSTPGLGAMIPCTEESREGIQVQAPGFFLIQLPFADDLRQNPPIEIIKSTEPVIDKMRAIVKQLHVPKGYDPTKYSNPSLQWHYRLLQAMALDENYPDKPLDSTLPKYKVIKKHVGNRIGVWANEIDKEFKFIEASTTFKGTKRTMDDDTGTGLAKKKARGGMDVNVNQAYRDGTLSKLTVAALKDEMKSLGLETSGRKADLLDRIQHYMENR